MQSNARNPRSSLRCRKRPILDNFNFQVSMYFYATCPCLCESYFYSLSDHEQIFPFQNRHILHMDIKSNRCAQGYTMFGTSWIYRKSTLVLESNKHITSKYLYRRQRWPPSGKRQKCFHSPVVKSTAWFSAVGTTSFPLGKFVLMWAYSFICFDNIVPSLFVPLYYPKLFHWVTHFSFELSIH